MYIHTYLCIYKNVTCILLLRNNWYNSKATSFPTWFSFYPRECRFHLTTFPYKLIHMACGAGASNNSSSCFSLCNQRKKEPHHILNIMKEMKTYFWSKCYRYTHPLHLLHVFTEGKKFNCNNNVNTDICMSECNSTTTSKTSFTHCLGFIHPCHSKLCRVI